ncbi:hypothetical protein GYMLUDRAFT_84424 [Collybiopsis luxurians FD-317 M1]|uniref:Crinkler (CRN) family protein n=1 Tax=Collybiopsis luxurians FD-317 M1 TaxID=944289 RepID=A0A0D0CIM8_9AGAR|nr:hypothetical protein GYMLUDRAFT_84424 [Collybiopsis luxurians FD-317 M1]
MTMIMTDSDQIFKPIAYKLPGFQQVEVTSSYDGLQLPKKIWTFTSGGSMPIMIRQEFHDGLTAILQWIECLISSTESILPISFTPTDNLCKDETEYPNPFKGHLRTCIQAGLAVTGHPGIGKSYFLYYIWTTRIALNLPTLFVHRRDEVLLWQDGQMYTAPFAQCSDRRLRNILDQTVWCLVDSSQDLWDVPSSVYLAGRFIIQAAAPRKERVSWTTKVPKMVFYYVMREWSAEELIAGLQLQEETFSEVKAEHLVKFHNILGGSARDAYRYAPSLDGRILHLENTAKRLGLDVFTHVNSVDLFNPLSSAAEPMVGESIRHQFMSVFPWNNEDRSQYEIRPPTEMVLDIIVEAIRSKFKVNRVNLFNYLAAGDGIEDATLASYFYDLNYHDFLCRDVVLNCFMFHPSKRARIPGRAKRYWVSKSTPAECYPFSMKKCYVYVFEAKNPPEFKLGHYYRPSSRIFLTFDSMLVVTATHVIIFQSSMSCLHGVSLKGLEWLAAQGFTTIECVYVSPSATKSVTIPFLAAVPDSLQYADLAQYPETVLPRLNTDKVFVPGPLPSKKDLPVKVIGIYHLHLDFKGSDR